MQKEFHDQIAVICQLTLKPFDAGYTTCIFFLSQFSLQLCTDRQNTPEKQWKITEEDWRNREKWDLYEKAVNEMIQKTSTTYAPWYVLESVDKKYARIKALQIVIRELEKVL